MSSSVRGELKAGEADVAIVGGGIVGLATAREIVTRFPSAKVVVVEKEHDIVKHQTSHNRCQTCCFHFPFASHFNLALPLDFLLHHVETLFLVVLRLALPLISLLHHFVNLGFGCLVT